MKIEWDSVLGMRVFTGFKQLPVKIDHFSSLRDDKKPKNHPKTKKALPRKIL